MKFKEAVDKIDKKMAELGFEVKSICNGNGHVAHNYLHRDKETAIHLEFGDPGAVLGLEEDSCPNCDGWALYHGDGRIQCPECGYEGHSHD